MAGDPRETYSDCTQALLTLGRDYNYWSQRLTDSSWQMCLAVIAGNWAFYGSAEAIMKSGWALSSLAVIFASLAIALLSSYILSEIHRSAFYRAESDWSAWKQRFERFKSGAQARDPFPATRLIDCIGILTRFAKTFLPLFAGAILVLGALSFPQPKSIAPSAPIEGQAFFNLVVERSSDELPRKSETKLFPKKKMEVGTNRPARHRAEKKGAAD